LVFYKLETIHSSFENLDPKDKLSCIVKLLDFTLRKPLPESEQPLDNRASIFDRINEKMYPSYDAKKTDASRSFQLTRDLNCQGFEINS
jgi:hypothetical protein